MNRPRKANRHLPPCVYLKHSAYWLVKGGKWTRLGGSLAEALAAYADRIEKPAGSGMPQLLEKVFAHHTPKLADQTRRSYRVAANRLSKIFADFSPEQVKGKHVAALKLSMEDKPAQSNHTVSFLRVVFDYAVEWQMVESNPCIGLKPYELKARSRYLTDSEFHAIRAKAGPRLQVIMDLCYLTGQRIGDVLAIHHRDIGEAGISFKPIKTSGSTQIQFVVAWNDHLRAAVEAAKALQTGVRTLSLLAGRSRLPPRYRTVVGQWWEACAAAGVTDANLHDLRAKAATDAKAQGIDAQVLLGHSDAKMTDRYLRLREAPVVRGPSFKRSA